MRSLFLIESTDFKERERKVTNQIQVFNPQHAYAGSAKFLPLHLRGIV
jgi:hypothetical protein